MDTVVGKIIEFPLGKATKKDKAVKIRLSLAETIEKYGKNFMTKSVKKSNSMAPIIKEKIVVPKKEIVSSPRRAVTTTDAFYKAIKGNKTNLEIKEPSAALTPPVEEQVIPNTEVQESTFVPYNGFPSPVDGSQPVFEMEQPVQTFEQKETAKYEPRIEEEPVTDDLVIKYTEPEYEAQPQEATELPAVNNTTVSVEIPRVEEELSWAQIYDSLASITSKSEELESKNISLTNKIDEITKKLESAKETARVAEAKLSTLQSDLAGKDAEISSLQSQVKTLESKVETLRANHNAEMQQAERRHKDELTGKEEEFRMAQRQALMKLKGIINRDQGSVSENHTEDSLAKVA